MAHDENWHPMSYPPPNIKLTGDELVYDRLDEDRDGYTHTSLFLSDAKILYKRRESNGSIYWKVWRK